MNPKSLKFAPREIFEKILEFSAIPTFDLIVNFQYRGIIIARRKIAPYKNQWALPGLRMMKPEGIEDALKRISETEIGVVIDPKRCELVSQYVAKFRTEFNRQDISTCYAISCPSTEITINASHFYGYKFINSVDELPSNTGAMYRYYVNLYCR